MKLEERKAVRRDMGNKAAKTPAKKEAYNEDIREVQTQEKKKLEFLESD